jgi:hypothetical protein
VIHRLIATILTGLLLALGFSMIGCKPPAPGPTQTPLPSPTPSPSPSPEPEIRCGPSHALAPAHQRDCEILVDEVVVSEFTGERGRTGNFPLDGNRVWRGRTR